MNKPSWIGPVVLVGMFVTAAVALTLWKQASLQASAAEASQQPEPAKAKGGHRPGTGRLGAEAYWGATRAQCRHEELAVGQRCPVCGQTRSRWPLCSPRMTSTRLTC